MAGASFMIPNRVDRPRLTAAPRWSTHRVRWLAYDAVMPRALVLGSGGQTALGWEVGVLAGLSRCGVRIDGWDLILGTSAGSIVGAWVAAGRLDDVYQRLCGDDPAVDRASMAAGMGNSLPYLLSLPGPVEAAATSAWTLGATVRRLAGIARRRGVAALPAVWAAIDRYLGPDALTADELTALAPISVGQRQRQVPRWETYWATRLGPQTQWPAQRLQVVTFCSTTSERRIFEASDGVPLTRVIAASAAVPGILGAVEIEGRQHMDAGPLDSTSADLAAGFDQVLILAPDANPGELARSVPQLSQAGARVTVVEPSDQASFGEGIQHLDAMRVPAAVAVGFHDGTAAAEQLA